MATHCDGYSVREVESGLEAVAWERPDCNDVISNSPKRIKEWERRGFSPIPLVRQSDAERALSDLKMQLEAARSVCMESQGTILTLIAERDQRDAELQQQHEAHRKTWRQLEQVTGLLREIEDEVLLDNSTAARIQIALSQQAEPLEPAPAQDEQQPVCWASSAALAKLQNGRNNSPCVLTDGPAEFNDTPLYAIAQTAPQFTSADESAVRELLAVLNRDGGQHQDSVGLAQAAQDALGEVDRLRQAQNAPQPEQSGLVDTWMGVKAIPVSAAEYAAIYRDECGLAQKSVMSGDGITARSGVSYVVAATPSPATAPSHE